MLLHAQILDYADECQYRIAFRPTGEMGYLLRGEAGSASTGN